MKPHYLSPRRRRRILGRDPGTGDRTSAAELTAVQDVEEEEGLDPVVVQDLVRAELQKILLERQDTLEKLAMGERRVGLELVAPGGSDVELSPFVRRLTEAELTGRVVDTSAGVLDADERLHRMQLEIERYKRRITKLCGSLERAEAALQQMAERGAEMIGIPSVFRTVQGLSRDDAQFMVKQDALSKIFQANVELRQRISVA